MKTLIAAAFAVALAVGIAAPVAVTPANAAVAVVVGGRLNGGIVVGRTHQCRRWGWHHGRRHCATWGWRHRVRNCRAWNYHHGRRGACRSWRVVYVWR